MSKIDTRGRSYGVNRLTATPMFSDMMNAETRGWPMFIRGKVEMEYKLILYIKLLQVQALANSQLSL